MLSSLPRQTISLRHFIPIATNITSLSFRPTKPTFTHPLPHFYHHHRHHFQTDTTSTTASTSDAHSSISPLSSSLPQSSPNRMILMDAMALLYRSHFAFGPDARLRTSSGEDTSVLFGFLNTLLNILELQPHPTHFAVIFDAPGKNFRHELFPGYKGQRPPTPEPISEAVPRLKALLQMSGIPQISAAGVEADDVIGTIAMRGIDAGFVVAIASPDKDFFQLLRKGLILLRPPSKADKSVSRYALLPYTEESFRNDWELDPEQFVDVLALAGDSSDNVPGVAGIGPKRAVALLQEYGSLENILENNTNSNSGNSSNNGGEEQQHGGREKKKVMSMPQKVSATLASQEGQEVARLSKLLVQINTKLDLPPVLVPLEEFRLKSPADAGLAALEEISALEFKMHGPRLKALWAAMGGGVVGRE